jgi:hypothetical protein
MDLSSYCHKAKTVPVTGRRVPEGCETSRLPHFLENRFTNGGEVVSLTRQAIPVTRRGVPEGCETSTLPHFLENWFTDGGEIASLTRRPLFIPGRFLLLTFLEAESTPGPGRIRLIEKIQ